MKRLDRLLDAFAIARRADPRAVLALVGDGPERPGLEARAARPDLAGAVLFAGHLEGSALHAWYCCAAVFALTSEFEPWGAVVNEALLGGVPVVCSREAGARALLAPGHNGEVVDAADLSRLARALAAWSSRAEPLGPEQLEAIRPSRMLRGFEEAVDGFCSAVDAAAAGTGAA